MLKLKEVKLIAIFFASLIICLSSCISEKKIALFERDSLQRDTITLPAPYIPHIKSGDLLAVYVTSLSPQASSYFNPYNAAATVTGGSTQLSTAAPAGFLVDDKGNIDLPLIGTIKVAELSTIQARDTIKKALAYYLKDPTVMVRFLNFKIAIMGEVKTPGIYVIPNERITIPEAIVLSNGLTNYAKLEDVQIIRETNNKKIFASVDLRSKSVFTSP